MATLKITLTPEGTSMPFIRAVNSGSFIASGTIFIASGACDVYAIDTPYTNALQSWQDTANVMWRTVQIAGSASYLFRPAGRCYVASDQPIKLVPNSASLMNSEILANPITPYSCPDEPAWVKFAGVAVQSANGVGVVPSASAVTVGRSISWWDAAASQANKGTVTESPIFAPCTTDICYDTVNDLVIPEGFATSTLFTSVAAEGGYVCIVPDLTPPQTNSIRFASSYSCLNPGDGLMYYIAGLSATAPTVGSYQAGQYLGLIAAANVTPVVMLMMGPVNEGMIINEGLVPDISTVGPWMTFAFPTFGSTYFPFIIMYMSTGLGIPGGDITTTYLTVPCLLSRSCQFEGGTAPRLT